MNRLYKAVFVACALSVMAGAAAADPVEDRQDRGPLPPIRSKTARS